MRRKKSANRAWNLVDCTPHRSAGGGFFPGLTEIDAEYESGHEANALKTLVLCHDVQKIASQPAEEPYLNEGKVHHTTPDFIVDAFVPGLRIEVKALRTLARSERALGVYAAIGRAYLERGEAYALLVDAQLEEEPRFHNVKLLHRYVTSQVPRETLSRVLAALRDGPLSISVLVERAALHLNDVGALIARRHICFDWGTTINWETTLVSLPDQPYGGLKLEHVLRSTRYGPFLDALAMGRQPADRRILADASAWRRHDYPIGPWSVVGGYEYRPPIRSLRPEELSPRSNKRRRNYAPGLRTVATDRAD